MGNTDSFKGNNIFLLQGKLSDGTYQEIVSKDISVLQKILTNWLRNNSHGFILKKEKR